jgi:hypothetical protein
VWCPHSWKRYLHAVLRVGRLLVDIMGILPLVTALIWLLGSINAEVAGLKLVPRELSINDIPACGVSSCKAARIVTMQANIFQITCLFMSVPKSGCKLDDIECICDNHDLVHAVSTCMVTNCTMSDNLGTDALLPRTL